MPKWFRDYTCFLFSLHLAFFFFYEVCLSIGVPLEWAYNRKITGKPKGKKKNSVHKIPFSSSVMNSFAFSLEFFLRSESFVRCSSAACSSDIMNKHTKDKLWQNRIKRMIKIVPFSSSDVNSFAIWISVFLWRASFCRRSSIVLAFHSFKFNNYKFQVQ